jgi:LSD1 subclass zinc finger protein
MASKSCFAAVLKGKNIVDHNTKKKECTGEKELSVTAACRAVLHYLCVGKVSIQCALCVLQLIFLHLRRTYGESGIYRVPASRAQWRIQGRGNFALWQMTFRIFLVQQSGTEQPFSRKSFFLLSRH